MLSGAEPTDPPRRTTCRRAVSRPHTRLPQLALVLAAAGFGTTFLVVQEAEGDAGVFPLIGARFAIAAVALAPFALARRTRSRNLDAEPRRSLLVDGGAAGAALAAGYVLQTAGLRTIDSSVSAFLTYLLVVFVPLIVAARTRRLPSRLVGLGVALAFGGMALLSGGVTGLARGEGELLTVGGALAFALHVLVLSAVSASHDVVLLTWVQLAVVAATCGFVGLFQGGYYFESARTWFSLVGLGLFATIVTFLLQTWAQSRLDPVRVSLLLTFEPVFAAVLGYLAGERLGTNGIFGGVAVIAGILAVELGTAAGPTVADRPAASFRPS